MENKKVKLQLILDEIEMQFDEVRSFFSVKTGKVVSVTSEELRAAEEDEPMNGFPEWQQDSIRVAINIVENFEEYIELPTKYDINECEMIEDFCYNLNNQKQQEALLRAITGRGAFRRFKDKLIDLNLEQKWFVFRGEKMKEIAIEWCEDNNIKYIE